VTAVALSATALGRAAADAATAGVADRIEFRQHDLALTFPSGSFDLVSAQYLHSPIEFPRVHVLQEAASAVTPGGLLLIVDHASVSPRSWADPEETLAPLDLSPDGCTSKGSKPASAKLPARTGRGPPSPTTSSL
jgi:SAM-dependent methyltransferase